MLKRKTEASWFIGSKSHWDEDEQLKGTKEFDERRASNKPVV